MLFSPFEVYNYTNTPSPVPPFFKPGYLVLEQLNMQAVYNVTHDSDEFVKEFMIAHEKVNIRL